MGLHHLINSGTCGGYTYNKCRRNVITPLYRSSFWSEYWCGQCALFLLGYHLFTATRDKIQASAEVLRWRVRFDGVVFTESGVKYAVVLQVVSIVMSLVILGRTSIFSEYDNLCCACHDFGAICVAMYKK